MARPGRLVAVYPSEEQARAAADAAVRAGAPRDGVRVGDDADAVASVKGEMRSEFEHTVPGPRTAGSLRETAKGMVLGSVVGGVIGAVVALPFAAIPFGDLGVGARLLIVAICGAFVGSTAGWVIGGGFGSRSPEEPLAAERGVTLTAPATRSIEQALTATSPIRLDLVDLDGQPIATVATGEEAPSVVHEIGRHMGNESREY